jgi:predicted RNA polymerase sigma factor
VCGLTTAQISAAFLLSETTAAQRSTCTDEAETALS